MSRNWNPNVAKIVTELEKMAGVTGCSTYPWHGATDTGVNGEPWGIDVQIAPWGNYADKAQEAAGDRIQKFVEANWSRLGIHYMIWWGWISYVPGAWQRYNPGYYNNPAASTDPETAMHMDHVHLQIHTNYVYKPPASSSPKGEAGEAGAKGLPGRVLFGIDVAGYQAGIDMSRVRAEGYEFAIVKATEGPYSDGSKFRNPEYTRQIAGARAAGMVTGAYHFLIETAPELQADLFLSVVRDGEPKILVVDFEAYNAPYAHLTPTNDTLQRFIACVRRVVGDLRPILVYSGRGFWNGGDPSGPLSSFGNHLYAWDAMYRSNDPVGNPKTYYSRVHGDGWGKPWGDEEPIMWQFTPGGRVAGFDLDVNAYAGTKAALWALADWDIPQPRRTKPAPSPAPAQPTIDYRVTLLEGSVTRCRAAITRLREDLLSLSSQHAPHPEGRPPVNLAKPSAKPSARNEERADASNGSVKPQGLLSLQDSQERPRPVPDAPRQSHQTTATKAIVAAALPLTAATASLIASGEVNQEALALAITGLITAALVYVAPNQDVG